MSQSRQYLQLAEMIRTGKLIRGPAPCGPGMTSQVIAYDPGLDEEDVWDLFDDDEEEVENPMSTDEMHELYGDDDDG